MNAPPTVEMHRVSASHGLAWLVQSLSLLRLQAGRLLLIALLMQFVLGLTQLPMIGLLVALAVPGLSAGLLQSFHVAAAGGQPELRTLFTPLATRVLNLRLLALGGLVFLVGVVSMSLLLSGNEELMDPGLLEQVEQGNLDAIASLNQEALGQMALAFLLGVSISGTLSYFAIPLIWFRQLGLGAALWAGLRALLVNWKAFLLLGLGLFLLFLPVAFVAGLLFGIVTAGGLMAVLVMGLIMILLLAFQLMLFGTQYCAFRDIFGVGPQEAREGRGRDEGQLVA
jgi:hypothetical protein